MNYKKGILSVILWFIYALTAGTVLVGTTMVMLLPEGGSRPIGLVIAGVWLALTGLVVFLLHRFLWVKWAQNGEGSGQVKLIIEGLAVVALIAVGITLRVRESMQYDISGAAGNIWFDAVKVTETTRIPQVVHGAVYFYLQVLHGLLVFLGNKMTSALVLQIVLQILTGIFFIFCGTETDRYGGCSGISCVLDVMPCSVWSSDSWTGTVISVIVDDWSVCVRGSTG